MKNIVKQELPIASYRDNIVEAVKSHNVVIITAETGAGKSTQVPQYLLEAGYDMVVTQPRRLTARTVAARVAEEVGEELGMTVGYRTAVDRQDSPATRCLFCTDGLALVRELIGANKGILILDEVHEWNENMEVLVAWAKKQVRLGCNFKVVIMSATLEAEELAKFFDGAPVISVPGRLFTVEERQPGRSIEDDVAKFVSEGHNILVIQPGKADINETIKTLRRMEIDSEILPLHGDLTPDEQAASFRHYDSKVVVSTNVVETGATIDDIDVVIDSGLERRIELRDNIEGLYIRPISLTNRTQRKGRAGRTKEGIYIDHCPVPKADRDEFPVAEILRRRLDQTVLRLAIAGFDMEELEFFHQPSLKRIQKAKESLIRLGCMNPDGTVTPMGRQINKLPVSINNGRMLIEANKRGVLDDIITAAAIMEQDGGIVVPTPSRKNPYNPDWREMVSDGHESDIIGQLEVWELAKSMNKDEMRRKGVSSNAYYKAKEIRQRLIKVVCRNKRFELGTTGNREDIIKSIAAGMVDHLYHRIDYSGEYRNGDEVDRQLGQSSLVRSARWLIGKPLDLEITTRRGKITLYLIEMASKVDPMWLAEIAPQLVELKTGLNPRYDSEKDVVVSTTETYFNGAKIKEEAVDDPKHEDAGKVFAQWLSSHSELPNTALNEVLKANSARQAKAKELNMRTCEETFRVYSPNEIYELYSNALLGARRVAEIQDVSALQLPALDEDLVKSSVESNPGAIVTLGKEFPIRYSSHNPIVEIDFYEEKGLDWRELPDAGIFLPDGREIIVDAYLQSMVSDNLKRPIEALSSCFKAKVRMTLNREQWDRCKDTKIVLITPESDEADIPFKEVIYGRDALTGEELVGYGTNEVNERGWSGAPYFNVFWTQNKAEAESIYNKAKRRLAYLKA
ncbi:MAG: hypothetical protein LBH36_03265 [Candidatus Nomurabacteria bacterium]|nr:hypothetical protein [Candidatus Nomurabacteria bacterium]